MAITTKITKMQERGFVQIDSTDKNGAARSYKVPQQNAKKFNIELKNQDKDYHLLFNITFFSSIVAGVFGTALFTKKIESSLIKFLIQTASAISLSTISLLGLNKYFQTKKEELLYKNGAKEIFYQA